MGKTAFSLTWMSARIKPVFHLLKEEVQLLTDNEGDVTYELWSFMKVSADQATIPST